MAQPDSMAVGVDFGTSTSLVAERTAWAPADVLPLGRTTTWLPSVAAHLGGRLVVGEDAEDADPELLIRSVKRAITDRRDGLTVPSYHEQPELPADEVIGAILSELAARAARLGRPLADENDLRLGCPAMWDGSQRRRLIDIATRAGLPLSDSGLIDEPVAAGVAWLANRFVEHAERPQGRLLVFDMGGGTLDIAVLDVVGGPRPEVSVLASLGVPMAGDALDTAIARDLRDEMLREGFDIAYHPQPALAWALLEREAARAKVRLSRAAEHPIVLPRQLAYPKVVRYRREQLEEALAGTVDHVLLVGGMSRIPYVGHRLRALFPGAAVHDSAGVAPEAAVVAGLAEKAGYERINIHRPGFDFVLEWDGGRRRHVLYDAYTPLYEPWQVYNGHSDLGYVKRLRYPDVPRHGVGMLRVQSITGRPVRLNLNGQLVDGLPVTFGSHDFTFKIYCDGGILLTDGSGRTDPLRVDSWPVIRERASGSGQHGRGHDHAALALRHEHQTVPDPFVPYPFNVDR